MPRNSIALEQLPLPKNQFLFDPTQDYSLEIGAGVGLHAIRFSRNHPHLQHIAIERTTTKFRKMQGRAQHHSLSNLHIFQDDAINWVCHNCPDAGLKKVFLLYPNPSRNNAAARWIRMPFFYELMRKMRVGAQLFWATNEEFYIQEILHYSANFPLQKIELKKIDAESLPSDYQALTHFEKKYLQRGQNCYHLTQQKI